MKIAIVIAANGLIAEELLKVAEHTVGHTSNISSIAFHAGESLEELFERYRITLLKLNVQNGIIFLIEGGNSCHQYAARYFAHQYSNSQVVTGVNLPMLVSVLVSESNEIDSQILAFRAELYGKEAISVIPGNTQLIETEITASELIDMP